MTQLKIKTKYGTQASGQLSHSASRQNQAKFSKLNHTQGSFTGANASTTRYQFCSSGNKESSTVINTQLMQKDILERKQSYDNLNIQIKHF
jgi:hypothetical protein